MRIFLLAMSRRLPNTRIMANDSSEVEIEPTEEPTVSCRHFLLCHTVWHDPAKPEDFSLGRIVIHLHPADGVFPTTYDRLFAYGQLFGTPGEYELVIRAVRIESVGYDEEVEYDIGRDGLPVEWRPNRPVVISGEDYADWFAVPLPRVPVPMPGVYEFQLFLAGATEPITRERVQARVAP